VSAPPRPSNLSLALAVGAAFVLVHVVLVLGTFDVYDLEETEYGNVAVAMLDGHVDVSYASLATDPEWGDGLMTGAGRRRRTVWSYEPTVAPFFALLGPTMFALKLWAVVFAGFWAALWFLLARAAAPRSSAWAAAALFVLPLPLVQRAAVSATSITAHLGSSLWHAAALVALVAAGRRGGLGWIALSGLLTGFGLYCGFSLAPLLAGVVFLAWSVAGLRGLIFWGAGTLPGLGLAAAFRDPSRAGGDLITALTGLQEGGAFRDAGLGTALETLGTALRFGAGYGSVDVGTADLHYSAIGVAYTLLCAALVVGAVVVARRAGPRAVVDPGTRALRVALALSLLGFAAGVAVTGFKLETTFFDGLRYLLPLAPLPALLLLGAADELGRRGVDASRATVALVAPVLVAHGLGFAGHFRADVFPAPWWDVPGYEPWVMKNYFHESLEVSRIKEERRYRWAIWSGLSQARLAPDEDLSAWGPTGGPATLPLGADSEVTADFLRGFGMGVILRGHEEEWGVVLSSAPREARLRLLEGMGMGHAHVGCSDVVRDALLGWSASEEDRAAIWYGLGRADLYCAAFAGGLPAGADEVAYQRGMSHAVERDYGPAIRFLRIY